MLSEFPTPRREEALELIQGGYDLHTHTEPSAFGRGLNDLDLITEASALGMAGVMIKAHYGCTASRAALVNLISGKTARAFGGLALNQPTGGLNPYAVENCLKMGGVLIWMPTRDSAHCLQWGDMPGDFFKRPGISILNEDGSLKDEVYDIFDVVKKYDAFLATGHLSLEESLLLCREGRRRNGSMILTHPERSRTKVPGELQKELAGLGVLIEKNWLNIAEGAVTAEEMAANIRQAGVSSTYLATDRGQAGFEHPAEGMLRFIETLLDQGFSGAEIRTMVRDVPARIARQ